MSKQHFERIFYLLYLALVIVTHWTLYGHNSCFKEDGKLSFRWKWAQIQNKVLTNGECFPFSTGTNKNTEKKVRQTKHKHIHSVYATKRLLKTMTKWVHSLCYLPPFRASQSERKKYHTNKTNALSISLFYSWTFRIEFPSHLFFWFFSLHAVCCESNLETC